MTTEQIKDLTVAASSLAHSASRIIDGGYHSESMPSGFEALCMAISGSDLAGHASLSNRIEYALSQHGDDVKSGLLEVALSINALADAISNLK